MRLWFTVAIMLILIGSGHHFGRGPERMVAHALGANLLLSLMNLALGTPQFDHLNVTLAAIDGFTLLAVGWVAIRANRVWPLVVTALQLIVIIAHASVLISVGSRQVYYGMMALAQYFELIVLAIGIACHAVRERRIGRYRDWRPGYEPRLLAFLSGDGDDRPAIDVAPSQSAAIKAVS